MGLTLLARASLPLYMWDHNFTSASCLINCLSTSVHSSYGSIYLVLQHKQPDCMNLKVFGYSFYPYLRPYNQHNLDFLSTMFVYLGISPSYKGHKSLNKDGKIFISKYAKFNKAEFPYLSLQTQQAEKCFTHSHQATLTLPSPACPNPQVHISGPRPQDLDSNYPLEVTHLATKLHSKSTQPHQAQSNPTTSCPLIPSGSNLETVVSTSNFPESYSPSNSTYHYFNFNQPTSSSAHMQHQSSSDINLAMKPP